MQLSHGMLVTRTPWPNIAKWSKGSLKERRKEGNKERVGGGGERKEIHRVLIMYNCYLHICTFHTFPLFCILSCKLYSNNLICLKKSFE